MPLVALLRHGEEEGTAEPDAPIHTRSPTGLSQRGRDQAEAARRFLEPIHASRVVCSNAQRAIETAEIVAQGRPIELVPGLAGLSLGELEGRPASELGELAELAADPDRRPPGGESLSDVLARARPAFEGVLSGSENTIIVSHKLVNSVLLANTLGIPLTSAALIQQDNAGINILDGGPDQLSVSMINVNPLDPLRRGITAATLV